MRKFRHLLAAAVSLTTLAPVTATVSPWEVAGLVGGATGIGLSEFYKKDLVPDEARWKTPPAIDASVRQGLVWSNTHLASRLSDVMLYGVVPVTAFAAPLATNHEYGRAALAIGESVVLTGVVTQLAKFSFARARPYAYYSNDFSNPDSKLSFFSGHTSYSFAFAVSGAMLLAESNPPSAPAIYSGAVLLALIPGYLRIAADKHYFTDVLTGAIVGSLVAYGVVRANLNSYSVQTASEQRLQMQKIFVIQ